MAAPVLVFALVVLSWLPKRYEEVLRRGWAGQLDHVIAYCAVALVARLAVRAPPGWLQ